MERREVERRAGLFMMIVMVMFVLLIVRLGELQLVLGQSYEELSQGNRLRLLPVFASRGEIFDRSGRLVAGNRPAFSVSLLHMGVEQLDKSIHLLSSLLQMEPERLTTLIDSQRGRWYEPIRLRNDISSLTHVMIEEHRRELPGVVVEPLPVREYPYGQSAAHIIGHLGEIDSTNLEQLHEHGYRSGDVVGKMGIEAVYDRYLRGTSGGRQVEVDSLGRPYRTLGQIDPLPGNDLYLTLDIELQLTTEQALDRVMAELREHPLDPMPGATVSAAVALDPRNGAVLALASRPAFNPDLFSLGISEKNWLEIQNDSLLPMLNRAIQGEYQPGSSFKMVTATAALETGRTYAQEIFKTSGGVFKVTATDVKHCWAYRYGGHGDINVVTAIGESCNIVFYELGKRVGIDDMAAYAREFGLGSPTGLRDLPGERKGLVPTRDWKRANYPDDPQWWLSETLDVAIGQGFHLYTPLQMAVYVSILGNGGIQYRPYLVDSVQSPAGDILLQVEPEILRTANVSPETLALIKQGMIATTSEGGTAYGSFYDFPVPVAGKTGTVEVVVPGKDDHGWFVCYAPADNPVIAIAVIMEQGGGGARAAAPVARAMLDAYFGFDGRNWE